MFYKDREFLKKLFTLSLPIIAQQFVMASLTMVDVFMIGQLGEVQVAAVGIANQMTFVITFILFGITSGAAVFTAQYWGKKDIASIHRVLGVCLGFSLIIGFICSFICVGFPEMWYTLYSAEAAVSDAGVSYIRIVGLSYFFMAITFSFAAQSRSIENVRLPMIASVIGVALNSVLNLLLIFGYGPFPELGVSGAAIATLIARISECAILVVTIYVRKTILAASFKEMLDVTPAFIMKYLYTAAPVLGNEVVWVLGAAGYNMIYSRIGTESMAAVGIAGTFEGMAFVLFMGLSNASAVMLGNEIGASRPERAHVYARHTIVLGVLGAFLVGAFMVLVSPLVLSLYNISDLTRMYTVNILIVISVFLWIKVSNLNLIGGILRSGGDTRIAFLLDIIAVWCIGLPAAYAAAFYFDLPVYFVMLAVMLDEVFKCTVAFLRYASKKWIHDVTV